jgi:hypothetical protein
MNTDPMRDPECTCPWTDEVTWTRHGSIVEPESRREYDPECPEHGGYPLLEAPAPCLSEHCCTRCDGTGFNHGDQGMCWDCRGTGHPHEQPPPPVERTWVCDGCMDRVTAVQIADFADYEHVLCRKCVDR